MFLSHWKADHTARRFLFFPSSLYADLLSLRLMATPSRNEICTLNEKTRKDAAKGSRRQCLRAEEFNFISLRLETLLEESATLHPFLLPHTAFALLASTAQIRLRLAKLLGRTIEIEKFTYQLMMEHCSSVAHQ